MAQSVLAAAQMECARLSCGGWFGLASSICDLSIHASLQLLLRLSGLLSQALRTWMLRHACGHVSDHACGQHCQLLPPLSGVRHRRAAKSHGDMDGLFHGVGCSVNGQFAARGQAARKPRLISKQAIMSPFFKVIVSNDSSSDAAPLNSQLSMITVVVANLTGLNNGGLYVLLRSSRLGRFGPKGYHEFDSRRVDKRPKTTLPHSFIFTKQLEQPVPFATRFAAQGPAPDLEAAKIIADADATLAKGQAVSTSPVMQPFTGVIAAAAVPSKVSLTNPPMHARKSSYSVFPRDNQPEPKPSFTLPATAYSPSAGKDEMASDPFADQLPPPPKLRLSGGKHTRDSSIDSLATIPIALRLSNINDIPPVQSFYQITPTSSQRPTRPEIEVPPMPSTLLPAGAEDEKDKQLPPVPRATSESLAGEEGQLRLSPTVYSPQEDANKAKSSKASSPATSPQPGRRWSPENSSRVNEAEWI